MSSARWLLDSNAVMGYLNQDPTPGFAAKIERCFGDGAAISVITLIEVLGWRGHSEQSRADAERLLRGLATDKSLANRRDWLSVGDGMDDLLAAHGVGRD